MRRLEPAAVLRTFRFQDQSSVERVTGKGDCEIESPQLFRKGNNPLLNLNLYELQPYVTLLCGTCVINALAVLRDTGASIAQ